jgi:hypothetical protein
MKVSAHKTSITTTINIRMSSRLRLVLCCMAAAAAIVVLFINMKEDEDPASKPEKKKTVIVEDASDSEYEDEELNSVWCNRRPSPGQWMEPVDPI